MYDIVDKKWKCAMASTMDVVLEAASLCLKEGRTVAIEPHENNGVYTWGYLYVEDTGEDLHVKFPPHQVMEDPDDQR